MKENCWEFKQCGREPGGAKVHEMGVCPAATSVVANGINSGTNGGRACWAVVGTFCGGIVQDNLLRKLHDCVTCEFRHVVEAEEGDAYVPAPQIAARVG